MGERHLTASMVVIDLRTAQTLLIWHNAWQKWMFPGGHIDPGETPGEAALRGQIHHPSPFITAEMTAKSTHEAPHQHVDLLFIGFADSRLTTTPQLDEVQGAKWFPAYGLHLVSDAREEVPFVAKRAWKEVN